MGSIWTNSDGLEVHFGSRRAGERANFGESRVAGNDVEQVVYISGADFTSGSATYNGTSVSLKAGITVREVIAEVTEAFNLGGTSPTLNVGVSGSVATNRAAQLTEAQAEAVGVYNLTSSAAGTLAAGTPLASDSTLTVGLGGTSPTQTGTAGKVKIVIRYQDPQAA